MNGFARRQSIVKVRYLEIANFRGIRHIKWHILADFIALIGPGDSTKTTLLDALGLVLCPTYRSQFTDADFTDCNLDMPIRIEAAVTELPDSIVTENQFGHDRSGISPDGRLEHDSVPGTEECLLIRLEVDHTLEPVWRVVRPDAPDEGRPISAAQRQKLGFSRIGDYTDQHLKWSRSSALTRLTEQRSEMAAVGLAAQRRAREAIFESLGGADLLQEAADEAANRARRLGSAPFTRLRPGLEPPSTSLAQPLLLHNESVPLTSYGLGTRRLTSIAIHDPGASSAEPQILAIDEIEHGLEPHRLAALLTTLKSRAADGHAQIFLTTHSPITIENLQPPDAHVVRSTAGITTVTRVSESLGIDYGGIRKCPSALLSRRVLVGEGSTEFGFLRELLNRTDSFYGAAGKAGSAALGIAVVDGGGGTSAAQKAAIFAGLGYTTALLIDNDDSNADAQVEAAIAAGVTVIRWEPGRAIEDALIDDLDAHGLKDLIALAAELKSESAVRDPIQAKLAKPCGQLEGLDPTAWISQTGKAAGEILSAVQAASCGRNVNTGEQASSKGWFKSIDAGKALGGFVWDRRDALRGTAFMQRMQQLIAFAYAPASAPENDDHHES
ncbi:hypothetical protein FAB82_23365 [Glycomyces buryatensis]|uniref:Uncharacterized protein n=1 Tax=Glycomyces buryatensis TaxID=2570927 RepID=A0A4S8PUM0_9ACTN|nr:hypothetical protein FAB82_23365 [Glycomyces buryatensis]